MSTEKKYDLTEGNVLGKLVKLSLPTIGTQLVQMAYSFADMFWLGRLSSGAVAASGTVAVFMWLSMSLQAFGGNGAEIGVSQSLGRGEPDAARGYLQSSMSSSLLLGVLCGAFYLLARHPLIGLFNISEVDVRQNSVIYLSIIALALPFNYVNAVAVSAFNASGNSAAPFYVNLVCMVLNVVLDPLLIFGLKLGVAGAAAATALCQATACVLMLISLRRYKHPVFVGMKLWRLPRREHLRPILRWGAPVAFNSFFFTFFVIIVSRFVASFGAGAMAVQRLGSQVDQFSYLVSSGFASALTAYIGQNYGAMRLDRIRRGFTLSSVIMGVWGLLATLNLVFFNRFFFRLFVPGEPEIIEMGARYLHILALCQLVACLEGVGTSVFRGYGKTLPPSVVSMATHVIRVVLAWTLSRGALEQNGIWWAMAISAFLRGAGAYIISLPYVYGRRAKAREKKFSEPY
ncbi:MAG: MATE family efflux transporter [Oscillospiraceae bacterium]|jgi:putative MATE family efflux protein|nr:MATE family efflux transporter [Oscillospiraceae bacterium]